MALFADQPSDAFDTATTPEGGCSRSFSRQRNPHGGRIEWFAAGPTRSPSAWTEILSPLATSHTAGSAAQFNRSVCAMPSNGCWQSEDLSLRARRIHCFRLVNN